MINIQAHPTIRGTYQLTAEQWLPKPLGEVFDFFADAYRLEELTPGFLHFHVVTPKPIPMVAGTRIDYRLRLHGIRINWQSEISEWEPPFRFVDRQIKGPYRLWHHLHTFESINGKTRVRDLVDYSVPGGPIIDRLFVRRDLLRIFSYRRAQLEKIFGKETISNQ